jgi:EAL domain-containing protein (putative c-di-GMP-specific phosphodiesterase class I)
MQIFDKGAEAKLVQTLAELKEAPGQWSGVVFAFAGLMEQYRSDYQIKIALNMLKDVLKNEEASVYVCADRTTVLLCDKVSRQVIDKAVFQLRYLFMDDPLAYTVEGEENPEFCMVYELDQSYDAFAAFARNKMLGGMRGGRPLPGGVPAPSAASAPAAQPAAARGGHHGGGDIGILKQVTRQIAGASKFFTASSLASVERDLSHADLSNVLRRQPVCAAIPDMMVRRVFDELYINIAHLRQALHVDTDLLSNRWLFKYLTELLDIRMLNMLSREPTKYLELPVSLNLNLRTLMSDAFLQFDQVVKPSVKVSLVIELQVSDVFEDMRAFHMARETVQKLGYRMCLDGLSDLSFVQVDRERLGFDLVKLQWNADISADVRGGANRRILEVVKAAGANRVILTRCDNRQAVDYGQAMGLSLFQGRYLDKLMNPLSRVEN